MFATLRTTASRSASTHSRLAARRVARVWIPQRYQSTNATNTHISGSGSGSAGSYFAAGVGGGVVVLLGAYSYYHFSGVKKTIDSAQVAHDYIKRTTASIAEKAPKSPNEILQFLRSVAKTYAGVVPGLSSYVDSTFDSLDELHETHGEELNKVLEKTYEEIKSVLKDVKENETLDTATAGKLVSALSKCAGDLNELGKKVGNDAFKKLEESYPAVAQTIGTSYNELKGLAQRGGPEARKLAEESIAQIQDVLKTSGKNQEEAWSKAKELVQGKTQKLKELAWDKAAEEAKENPEVTKLLKESKDTFLQQGVSVSSLGAVLDRIKTAVEEGGLDQGKLGELKDFVQDKAREAQSKGWGSLQQWVKTMPGGDEALKKMSDVDIQALMELSKNKTGDAKQLAEETYRDVLKVLQEKAAKAKKITDASVSEAKSKTS